MSRIQEMVESTLEDLRSVRGRTSIEVDELEAAFITLADPNAHWIPRRRAERTIKEHYKRKLRYKKQKERTRKKRAKRANKRKAYWSSEHYYQRYAFWLRRRRGSVVEFTQTEYTFVAKYLEKHKLFKAIGYGKEPDKPWAWEHMYLFDRLGKRPDRVYLRDLPRPENYETCRSKQTILPYFHERWLHSPKEGTQPDEQKNT